MEMMTTSRCMGAKLTLGCVAVIATLATSTPAIAESEIDTLKKELAEQRKLIQELLDARESQKTTSTKPETQPSDATPPTSGITFYGTIDVNVLRSDSGFGNKFSIGSGGMSASSLGARGFRDLGGGLKAIGEVEAGVALDTGAVSNGAVIPGINRTVPSSGGLVGSGSQIFARQAYAGFSSNYGSLTAGRQYTGSYIAAAAYGNAMGAGFAGNGATFLPIIGGMPTRVNNSLVYRTPRLRGFVGHLTYTTGSENNVTNDTAVGAVTTNDDAGKGWDAALLYGNGPLTVAVTTWSVKNASFVTAGETALADKTGWQAVANYNLGFAKVYAAFVSGEISGGNYENVTMTLSKASGASLSASVPLGKSTLYASYAQLNDKSPRNRDGRLIGLAYAYDLYKNTKLYASWGKQFNDTGSVYSLATAGDLVGNVTTAGFDPTGIMIGANFKF